MILAKFREEFQIIEEMPVETLFTNTQTVKRRIIKKTIYIDGKHVDSFEEEHEPEEEVETLQSKADLDSKVFEDGDEFACTRLKGHVEYIEEILPDEISKKETIKKRVVKKITVVDGKPQEVEELVEYPEDLEKVDDICSQSVVPMTDSEEGKLKEPERPKLKKRLSFTLRDDAIINDELEKMRKQQNEQSSVKETTTHIVEKRVVKIITRIIKTIVYIDGKPVETEKEIHVGVDEDGNEVTNFAGDFDMNSAMITKKKSQSRDLSDDHAKKVSFKIEDSSDEASDENSSVSVRTNDKKAAFNLTVPEHASNWMEIMESGEFSLDSEEENDSNDVPDTATKLKPHTSTEIDSKKPDTTETIKNTTEKPADETSIPYKSQDLLNRKDESTTDDPLLSVKEVTNTEESSLIQEISNISTASKPDIFDTNGKSEAKSDPQQKPSDHIPLEEIVAKREPEKKYFDLPIPENSGGFLDVIEGGGFTLDSDDEETSAGKSPVQGNVSSPITLKGKSKLTVTSKEEPKIPSESKDSESLTSEGISVKSSISKPDKTFNLPIPENSGGFMDVIEGGGFSISSDEEETCTPTANVSNESDGQSQLDPVVSEQSENSVKNRKLGEPESDKPKFNLPIPENSGGFLDVIEGGGFTLDSDDEETSAGKLPVQGNVSSPITLKEKSKLTVTSKEEPKIPSESKDSESLTSEGISLKSSISKTDKSFYLPIPENSGGFMDVIEGGGFSMSSDEEETCTPTANVSNKSDGQSQLDPVVSEQSENSVKNRKLGEPESDKPKFNLPIPENSGGFLEVIEGGGFSIESDEEESFDHKTDGQTVDLSDKTLASSETTKPITSKENEVLSLKSAVKVTDSTKQFNLPIPENSGGFLDVIEGGGFSLDSDDEEVVAPPVTESIESVAKSECVTLADQQTDEVKEKSVQRSMKGEKLCETEIDKPKFSLPIPENSGGFLDVIADGGFSLDSDEEFLEPEKSMISISPEKAEEKIVDCETSERKLNLSNEDKRIEEGRSEERVISSEPQKTTFSNEIASATVETKKRAQESVTAEIITVSNVLSETETASAELIVGTCEPLKPNKKKANKKDSLNNEKSSSFSLLPQWMRPKASSTSSTDPTENNTTQNIVSSFEARKNVFKKKPNDAQSVQQSVTIPEQAISEGLTPEDEERKESSTKKHSAPSNVPSAETDVICTPTNVPSAVSDGHSISGDDAVVTEDTSATNDVPGDVILKRPSDVLCTSIDVSGDQSDASNTLIDVNSNTGDPAPLRDAPVTSNNSIGSYADILASGKVVPKEEEKIPTKKPYKYRNVMIDVPVEDTPASPSVVPATDDEGFVEVLTKRGRRKRRTESYSKSDDLLGPEETYSNEEGSAKTNVEATEQLETKSSHIDVPEKSEIADSDIAPENCSETLVPINVTQVEETDLIEQAVLDTQDFPSIVDVNDVSLNAPTDSSISYANIVVSGEPVVSEVAEEPVKKPYVHRNPPKLEDSAEVDEPVQGSSISVDEEGFMEFKTKRQRHKKSVSFSNVDDEAPAVNPKRTKSTSSITVEPLPDITTFQNQNKFSLIEGKDITRDVPNIPDDFVLEDYYDEEEYEAEAQEETSNKTKDTIIPEKTKPVTEKSMSRTKRVRISTDDSKLDSDVCDNLPSSAQNSGASYANIVVTGEPVATKVVEETPKPYKRRNPPSITLEDEPQENTKIQPRDSEGFCEVLTKRERQRRRTCSSSNVSKEIEDEILSIVQPAKSMPVAVTSRPDISVYAEENKFEIPSPLATTESEEIPENGIDVLVLAAYYSSEDNKYDIAAINKAESSYHTWKSSQPQTMEDKIEILEAVSKSATTKQTVEKSPLVSVEVLNVNDKTPEITAEVLLQSDSVQSQKTSKDEPSFEKIKDDTVIVEHVVSQYNLTEISEAETLYHEFLSKKSSEAKSKVDDEPIPEVIVSTSTKAVCKDEPVVTQAPAIPINVESSIFETPKEVVKEEVEVPTFNYNITEISDAESKYHEYFSEVQQTETQKSLEKENSPISTKPSVDNVETTASESDKDSVKFSAASDSEKIKLGEMLLDEYSNFCGYDFRAIEKAELLYHEYLAELSRRDTFASMAAKPKPESPVEEGPDFSQSFILLKKKFIPVVVRDQGKEPKMPLENVDEEGFTEVLSKREKRRRLLSSCSNESEEYYSDDQSKELIPYVPPIELPNLDHIPDIKSETRVEASCEIVQKEVTPINELTDEYEEAEVVPKRVKRSSHRRSHKSSKLSEVEQEIDEIIRQINDDSQKKPSQNNKAEFWHDKWKYDDAETKYREMLAMEIHPNEVDSGDSYYDPKDDDSNDKDSSARPSPSSFPPLPSSFASDEGDQNVRPNSSDPKGSKMDTNWSDESTYLSPSPVTVSVSPNIVACSSQSANIPASVPVESSSLTCVSSTSLCSVSSSLANSDFIDSTSDCLTTQTISSKSSSETKNKDLGKDFSASSQIGASSLMQSSISKEMVSASVQRPEVVASQVGSGGVPLLTDIFFILD